MSNNKLHSRILLKAKAVKIQLINQSIEYYLTTCGI